MHVAVRVRWILARRPWIYWAIIAALAAGVAAGIHAQLRRLDDERAAWGDTRGVLVAEHQLAPGDPIAVSTRTLPVAMLPAGALGSLPDGARLRQRVGAGEILVDVDVVASGGPAARAPAGTVVVEIPHDSPAMATIGLDVRVVADGAVLTERATVVEVTDAAVYVAVTAGDGPAVAAASHAATATLLYLP